MAGTFAVAFIGILLLMFLWFKGVCDEQNEQKVGKNNR